MSVKPMPARVKPESRLARASNTAVADDEQATLLLKRKPPKAKQLILNLLMVADGVLTSKQLIGSARLFKITENSIRVTLARLTADNMVATTARGQYALGPAAKSLAADVASWRELDKRLCEWDQAWIAVYVGMLGRTDRSALTQRKRVLSLAGFKEFTQGVWLRPHNIVGGVPALRERLYRLGLQQEAMVLLASEMDEYTQSAVEHLWDVEQLNGFYSAAANEMDQWRQSVDSLDIATAAKESFLMGDNAIRKIVFDPLLPAAMVDVKARQKFIEAIVEYDKTGRAVWNQFYQQL